VRPKFYQNLVTGHWLHRCFIRKSCGGSWYHRTYVPSLLPALSPWREGFYRSDDRTLASLACIVTLCGKHCKEPCHLCREAGSLLDNVSLPCFLCTCGESVFLQIPLIRCSILAPAYFHVWFHCLLDQARVLGMGRSISGAQCLTFSFSQGS
jgi:hypothetical protein